MAPAPVQAANSLTISSDRLNDAKTSSSTSSKAWERQPKFWQDHVLRLMAYNDTDIKTAPTAPLVTFLVQMLSNAKHDACKQRPTNAFHSMNTVAQLQVENARINTDLSVFSLRALSFKLLFRCKSCKISMRYVLD